MIRVMDWMSKHIFVLVLLKRKLEQMFDESDFGRDVILKWYPLTFALEIRSSR